MNQEFELKLSTQELNTVLFALSKQPYEAVSTLIEKIVAAAKEQQAPREEVKTVN